MFVYLIFLSYSSSTTSAFTDLFTVRFSCFFLFFDFPLFFFPLFDPDG